MKVSTKIAVSVGTLVLLVSMVLGSFAIVMGSMIVEDQVESNLQTQARLGATIVSNSVSSRLAILQEIADRARTRTMDWETQKTSLSPDVDRHGYLDFAIVTPDGKARYVLESTEAQLGDRDYVKSALAGTRAVSDVLISRVTGKPVVMYAVPIFVGGIVRGALIARSGAESLGTYLGTLAFGKSGYTYMVNSKGMVVAHPNSELVLKQFAPIEAAKEDPGLASLAKAFELIIKGGSGRAEYFYNGKDIVCGWAPVEGTAFSLAIASERSEYRTGIDRLSVIFLVAALLCIAIGIAVALLIGRTVSRSIVETSSLLADITKGDGDLTRSLQARTSDEIGTLARNFNAFVETLRGMVTKIRASAESLGEVGADLSANMEETSASIIQIAGTIESVKDQVTEQAAGVNETLATVEQITRNIESFKERIDDQAANVTEASASIEELVASIRSVSNTLEGNTANIQSLLDSSVDGKEKISAVADIIRRIGTAAEGMLEASSVIESIASQTNLLSMNAAIEAAHAGDAGRGFAVVADEIRKLSENSNEQAKSISKVLADIKGSIDEAVAYSREADASFDGMLAQVRTVSDQEREIKNAMMEQSIGGGQVLEAIVGINQITSQIHGGSAEILVGSRTILDEMNRLTTITQAINQSVNEMAGGAKEISDSIAHVTELSVRNRQSVQTLEGQVARFKVD